MSICVKARNIIESHVIGGGLQVEGTDGEVIEYSAEELVALTPGQFEELHQAIIRLEMQKELALHSQDEFLLAA